MKTFTLEEAQSLLPVLESLLKRALESKQAAEKVEADLSALSQRIYVSGGMYVNVGAVAKQRAEVEDHTQRMRESIAEIDAIGVQVQRSRFGSAGLSMQDGRRDRAAVLAHGRDRNRSLAHHGLRFPGSSAGRRALPSPLQLEQSPQLVGMGMSVR